MDEQDAKRRLAASSVKEVLGANLELRPLPNGEWLATSIKLPEQGVVFKSDGREILFLGALGKLVPKLGLPASPERRLGSARQGRYQLYEGGIGVWEALDKIGDIGFPIAKWDSLAGRAMFCNAMIAFFDLRGFTNWAALNQADPGEIQRIIETLEDAFQASFRDDYWSKLFAKSTGDGFMVVSEASWSGTKSADIQAEHAKKFCQACAGTIRAAQGKIPKELAIGCGITTGRVTQLFLLGRVDYIGPKINEASKIQAAAYNELCIAEDVVQLLRAAGLKIVGWPLPGKGHRVSSDAFGDGTAAA